MRKLSEKTLKRKCMALWQGIVKSNADHKCEVCGRSDGILAAHHIVGRKNLTLRYDPKNGCCLCYQHHVGGNQSAHNDPQWFLNEWLVTKRPDDYNYLWEKKMEIATNMDYEKRLEGLRGNEK